MFRSYRENGEWGTPEQRRINLKLLIMHILVSDFDSGKIYSFFTQLRSQITLKDHICKQVCHGIGIFQ
jgi:hypothetical protein